MKHVNYCVLNPNNFFNVNNLQITPCMVQNALDKRYCGKSCGNDGLSVEHFKHADGYVHTSLSISFTGVIRHGYLPGNVMETIISDVNNYRPIALVTVASKVCENILLLELMDSYPSTTDNQFGLKKGHSTDHCF